MSITFIHTVYPELHPSADYFRWNCAALQEGRSQGLSRGTHNTAYNNIPNLSTVWFFLLCPRHTLKNFSGFSECSWENEIWSGIVRVSVNKHHFFVIFVYCKIVSVILRISALLSENLEKFLTVGPRKMFCAVLYMKMQF